MKWFERLKKAREDRNLSLMDVKNNTKNHISPQTLIEYESGRVFPKLNVIVELCELYETSLNYIVYGQENAVRLNTTLKKALEVVFSLITYDKAYYDSEKKLTIITDSEINNCCKHLDQLYKKCSKEELINIKYVLNYLDNIE